MSLIPKEATALEAACRHFIDTYAQALPRVAFRAMAPVLDAFVDLVKARPDLAGGRPAVMIHMYPLPKTFENQMEGLRGAVLMNLEDKAFYWFAGIPMMTPNGPALFTPLGNPANGRRVSPEDLLELNVSLIQVTESLLRVAVEVQTVEMINMPSAKA